MGRFRRFLLPTLAVANGIAGVACVLAPAPATLLVLVVLSALTYLDIATRPAKQGGYRGPVMRHGRRARVVTHEAEGAQQDGQRHEGAKREDSNQRMTLQGWRYHLQLAAGFALFIAAAVVFKAVTDPGPPGPGRLAWAAASAVVCAAGALAIWWPRRKGG